MHKTAGIEKATNGIGISTSARIYARNFFQSQGNSVWASAPNSKLNDLLAMNFANAQPLHRFRLRNSNEVAEIRKSEQFYFVAAMRGGTYDIIVIQRAFKQPTRPEISKRRLESPDWGKQ